MPLCVQHQKGKIQANTQGYHIIVNKNNDLLGLNYFKITSEVITANEIRHVLATLDSVCKFHLLIFSLHTLPNRYLFIYLFIHSTSN